MGKTAKIMDYDSKTRSWICRGRCPKGAAAVLRSSGVGAQKVAKGKRLKTGGSAKALDAEIKGRGLVRHDNAFSSRYKGVNWHKMSKTWRAAFYHGGKTEHLGCFATEEEAKACYDARCLELGLDPDARSWSGFRGVYWVEACRVRRQVNSKWRAIIQVDGKYKTLGSFEATARGEVDAALAFDVAARVVGRLGSANFELQAKNFELESATFEARPADFELELANFEAREAATNCWATAWHDDKDEGEDEDEVTAKGTEKHYTTWENDFNVLGYPLPCTRTSLDDSVMLYM
jgi:hypothetical protein